MQKRILILLLLCLFSCTVQKRVYLPGYSIQWKKNNAKVKNDALASRLEEENNPIAMSEKSEAHREERSGLNLIALDSVVEQELAESNTAGESFKRKAPPTQTKLKTIHQKSGIKTVLHNDPEEEREPKYRNGFMQVLAVFLGIICGIIASVFAILLIFLAGDFSAFDSNGNESGNRKTFKSVFLAAFRVTFMVFSALLIIAALILLAIFLYFAYGIWALIGAIVGTILILLLLTFLFNKAFDFVFHER